MTQLAHSTRPTETTSAVALTAPSSAEYSSHLKATGSPNDLRKFKISCTDSNGSYYDLSIDNRDSNLIERKIHNVAKVHLTKNSDGDSFLSVERSRNFNGEVKITSSDGVVHSLHKIEEIADLKLPSIQAKGLELKVEVPNLEAKPIDKTISPELYEQYKDFKKLGGEIVVVPNKENGFAYQLQRGEQVIETIQPPTSRIDFHANRDKLLTASLAKLAKEESSSLTYKGKDLSFSRAQSPELYADTKRLSELGLIMEVRAKGDDSLIFNIVDKKTGYAGSNSITIKSEDFVKMARGQDHLSPELKTFLGSVKNRSDLLQRSDGKSTIGFEERVKELAQKIPEQVVDILMADRWTITAKNHISNKAPLADGPNEERLPLGRCIPTENDLQVAEYQTSSQVADQLPSDPKSAIYHEVGHVLFFKMMSENPDTWSQTEAKLNIALERDLGQLGDFSKITDPKDPELAEKLKYYSSLSEGFAESYEGMISADSNGGRIMPKYFPNFSTACEQLARSQNLL